MGTVARHSDDRTMPPILLNPPDLGPDFWADPDIIAAVEHERLGQFLLAFRGARRPRWSQDQIAKWLGCNQSTISQLENGRLPATDARLDRVVRALRVPPSLVTHWGQRL